jgi:hypothetical protein
MHDATLDLTVAGRECYALPLSGVAVVGSPQRLAKTLHIETRLCAVFIQQPDLDVQGSCSGHAAMCCLVCARRK